MYSRKFGIHGLISAAIAFAIVGICALVLDRGYLFSAPAGVVEVAQVSPVQPLDEVTVVGDR
jgi:hypothetical protein